MSRGNPKRLSGGPSKMSTRPIRPITNGSRVDRFSGRQEPAHFDKWYIKPENGGGAEVSGSGKKDLAKLALQAVELQKYLGENFGHALTFDEALDFVEAHPDFENE